MIVNKNRMKLSNEEIEAGRTERGGFTRETLASWGISWPPPHNWKKALLAGEQIEVLEPESHPDSIEAELLHEIIMALIETGNGHLLASIENANKFYGCNIPTVADIVGGRPSTALIDGGISWDDKVYRFSVMRKVS